LNLSNTRIIPYEFKYYEPETLSEAVELLDKLGPEAKILAGGTDLLVQIKMGTIRPKYIVNIKKIKDLYGIRDGGDKLIIGALTKLREIERNSIVKERFYALYEAVKSMAGVQIRNMATIGGNLCNASPAADTAPPLIVYNAELVIYGPNGYRRVRVEEFFKGPKKTVLKHNEILTHIEIPYESRKHGSAFIKIARVAMDLAKVNVAAKLVVDDHDNIVDVAIALGSVAPTPVRARSVESVLRGKKFSEREVWEAAKLVVNDISPITDVRSTAEYRRWVSRVITYDALIKSYERLKRG